MAATGNAVAASYWEARLPPSQRPRQADSQAMEAFIRAKYEARAWAAGDWPPPEALNTPEPVSEVLFRLDGFGLAAKFFQAKQPHPAQALLCYMRATCCCLMPFARSLTRLTTPHCVVMFWRFATVQEEPLAPEPSADEAAAEAEALAAVAAAEAAEAAALEAEGARFREVQRQLAEEAERKRRRDTYAFDTTAPSSMCAANYVMFQVLFLVFAVCCGNVRTLLLHWGKPSLSSHTMCCRYL